MIKYELINVIAKKLDLTQKESKKMENTVLDTIVEGVTKDGKVKLADFGNFETKYGKERIGRNRRNLEEIKIPARMVVKFKVSKKFLKTVSENRKEIIK